MTAYLPSDEPLDLLEPLNFFLPNFLKQPTCLHKNAITDIKSIGYKFFSLHTAYIKPTYCLHKAYILPT